MTAAGADIAAELDDLDLDTDLAGAVVAVEWGEGVAERLADRHLLVRLDRRPDDVRVASVHRRDPAADPHRDPRAAEPPAGPRPGGDGRRPGPTHPAPPDPDRRPT